MNIRCPRCGAKLFLVKEEDYLPPVLACLTGCNRHFPVVITPLASPKPEIDRHGTAA